ncbi:MAG: translation elongation factor Ts [Planctomycetes bacterium]|nr:translation elongation factor Ts [Planctomycetota bacterium]
MNGNETPIEPIGEMGHSDFRISPIKKGTVMETTEVSFTAKDVMALRQKTGMGMMDCKKALTECNGDMAAATDWLREHTKGKMESRTERAAGEGRIDIAIDGSNAVIIEVLTETDFTAKNDNFVAMTADVAKMCLAQGAGDVSATDEIKNRIDDVRLTTRENMSLSRGVKLEGGSFGSYIHHDGKRGVLLQLDGQVDAAILKGICQHIVAMDPQGISEADMPSDTIEEIRSEAIKGAQESGKNEEIAQKIADGKVRKYLEENTLLAQKYVVDDSKTVKEILPADATITKFIRYTLGA